MINEVRLINEAELDSLLTLYQHLNPDDPVLVIDEVLRAHWQAILAEPHYYYFVIAEDSRLVSACTLAIIKNLTRSARPYGLIENVVTHPDHRKKGYGTAVLQRAVETARHNNCYKIMLMTSRKDENILSFYERAGFVKGEKTGFIIRL